MMLFKLLAIALLLADLPGAVIDGITLSGRCAALGEAPDARVGNVQLIAPGQPPLFSFRLYEGQARQRFGNTDLMLDDAGH